MEVLGKILYFAIIVVGGILITRKLIPFLFLRFMALIGSPLRLTPISKKRMDRFKRIKRGYWSFLTVSVLFVTSLFLELIINEKPLYLRYGDHTAYPAIADWVNEVPLFFLDISTYYPQKDFGQPGNKGVDFKDFAKTCADPSQLDPKIAEAKKAYEKAKGRFEKLKEPAPDAKKFLKSRYAQRKRVFERRRSEFDVLTKAKETFTSGEAFILNTLYPYSKDSFRYDLAKRPPNPPDLSNGCILGTTPNGRDVLVQLLYGFRISLSFALVVALCGYLIGVIVGGFQGYYGGWVDILTQRFVEIWGSIPFLFTIMIIASLVTPNFWMLVILMVILRSWLGITYYVRGEFYREKAKDYVQAAIGSGVSDWKIITKHILPNSLVPVVTFAPFGIVAYISSLVSLDYLGFGLPSGTPSWGALLRLGLDNFVYYPHLVTVPVIALALTLFMVVMVGEAVREAFDPKVFSRLR